MIYFLYVAIILITAVACFAGGYTCISFRIWLVERERDRLKERLGRLLFDERHREDWRK